MKASPSFHGKVTKRRLFIEMQWALPVAVVVLAACHCESGGEALRKESYKLMTMRCRSNNGGRLRTLRARRAAVSNCVPIVSPRVAKGGADAVRKRRAR